MINKSAFNEILNSYKATFAERVSDNKELFKWKMLKCFQDNWDISAENFADMVDRAFAQTDTLLASYHHYPLGMIKEFIQADSQAVRSMFSDLYDEDRDVYERIAAFKETARRLMPENINKTKQSYQDDRAITTYLWLRYPDKYYICKSSVAKKVSKELLTDYTLKDNKIADSFKMYREINALLKQDAVVRAMLDGVLTADCYPDPELITLTVDFCFYIVNYYHQEKNEAVTEKTAIEERRKDFEKWALNNGKDKGVSASTVKLYINSLNRVWKRTTVTDKRESPYNYGKDDIEEITELFTAFKYNGDFADSDCRLGFNMYIEFLQSDKQHTTTEKKVNKMSSQPKNIIMYGPPGTGKTYNTVLKAMQIIAPEKHYDNTTYTEAKAEYDRLLGDRIQFITFHQSYGYEEFIEGIKPETTDDGQIEYEVKSGIFKTFCEKASTPILENKKEDFGLNPYATVWKVSLEGTGDNETRRECLNNGHIRIGFDSYGADISDETVFNPAIGGKVVLNTFINKMKIGDIVLSCYSATTIDAIGVVTGGYEWHDEYDKYKRLRNVKWLVKNIKEDITKLNNNTTLTLASVYKLNISVSDVINLANKYNSPIKAAENSAPYVFIIDEINRGNISKIFGELITLIEESKRKGEKEETKVVLPYSNESFTVPSNVYIIGTMNTADRSIAAIDTALRRRFHFEEMLPQANLLKDITVENINVSLMLETINKRIEVLFDREHTIGHAYFIGLKNNSDISALAEIFKMKVIPLLQEYFYEDYEKIRLVLGDNQKTDTSLQFVVSNKIMQEELFGNNSGIELDAEYAYSINHNALNNPLAYIGIYTK